MTRINVIPVEELTDKHLLGEYNEIVRIPKYMEKSFNRKDFIMDECPKEYVLGKGHVKFFYDKLLWLEERYLKLADEMDRRGMSPKRKHKDIFKAQLKRYYNNYIPTQEALLLNRQRIYDRLNNVK